jgi:hypothetical protein
MCRPASCLLFRERSPTRPAKVVLLPPADTFSWSPSTRQDEANWIDGTFVEDSQSGATNSVGEYVSGLARSYFVASTAIAQYLFYSTAPAGWNGQLIDVYA